MATYSLKDGLRFNGPALITGGSAWFPESGWLASLLGLAWLALWRERDTEQQAAFGQAAEAFIACPQEALSECGLLDFFPPSERGRLEPARPGLHDGQVRHLREMIETQNGQPTMADIVIHSTEMHGNPCLMIQLRAVEENEPAHPPAHADGSVWRRDALLQGVANATNRLMQPGS